jgi:hypothetical protein
MPEVAQPKAGDAAVQHVVGVVDLTMANEVDAVGWHGSIVLSRSLAPSRPRSFLAGN